MQAIDKHMQAMNQVAQADPSARTFSLSILVDHYVEWRKEVKKNQLALSQLGENAKPFAPLPEGDPNFVSFATLVGAEAEKQRLREGLINPGHYPLLFPHRTRGVLLYGPPGSGKCWGAGTKMMLFDGRSKCVEEIVAGDQLMGDDSTPRTVQAGSVIRGHTGDEQERPAHMMAIDAGNQPRRPDEQGLYQCKYVGCVYRGSASNRANHEKNVGLHTIPAVKPAMYRITSNNKGRDTWTCNESHILVLKFNRRLSQVKKKTGGIRTKPWYYVQLEVVDGVVVERNAPFETQEEAQEAREEANRNWQPLVWEGPVYQFLRISSDLKSRAQMFSPSLVRFGSTDKPLREIVRDAMRAEQAPGSEHVSFELVKLVAWAIGVWLADGTTNQSNISQIKDCQQQPDHSHTPIVDQLKLVYQLLTGRPAGQDAVPPHEADSMDVEEEEVVNIGIVKFDKYSSAGNAVYHILMGTVFRRILREYEIIGSKKFPHALLSEDEHVRRAIFAGVIDGDGYACQEGKMYEVAAKDRIFIDGLVHLARGLGFSTGNIGKKSCTNEETGQVYTGHRVLIGGADLWKDVHTVLAYKRMSQSTPNKDQRYDGFTVEKIDHAAYYGFTLDGNGRCLMGDFVVTHNTKLMQALAYEVRKTTAVFFPQPDQLLGRYVGQTESNIVALYTAASELLRSGKKRVYPGYSLPPAKYAIIFIDEGEGLLGSGREEDASKQRTVNTFLQQMDGASSNPLIVTAVATNFPQSIDPAALRRLQLKILVDQPRRAARLELIKRVLRERYSWPDERGVKGKENAWLHNIATYGYKPMGDVERLVKGRFSTTTVTERQRVPGYFEEHHLETLANITGPSVNSKCFMLAEDDREYHEDAILKVGFSLADLTTALRLACNGAALRTIQRDVPCVFHSVTREREAGGGGDQQQKYQVFEPADGYESEAQAKAFESIRLREGTKLISFDLRLSDIEQALHATRTSVKLEDYRRILADEKQSECDEDGARVKDDAPAEP